MAGAVRALLTGVLRLPQIKDEHPESLVLVCLVALG